MAIDQIKLLREYGFKQTGMLRLEGDQYKIEWPLGIQNRDSVYALCCQSQIIYIGSAYLPRGRMASYALDLNKKAGKRKIHAGIAHAMSTGNIQVYTRTINTILATYQGMPVDLLLGLEHGLIILFRPSLNVRGKKEFGMFSDREEELMRLYFELRNEESAEVSTAV